MGPARSIGCGPATCGGRSRRRRPGLATRSATQREETARYGRPIQARTGVWIWPLTRTGGDGGGVGGMGAAGLGDWGSRVQISPSRPTEQGAVVYAPRMNDANRSEPHPHLDPEPSLGPDPGAPEPHPPVPGPPIREGNPPRAGEDPVVHSPQPDPPRAGEDPIVHTLRPDPPRAGENQDVHSPRPDPPR